MYQELLPPSPQEKQQVIYSTDKNMKTYARNTNGDKIPQPDYSVLKLFACQECCCSVVWLPVIHKDGFAHSKRLIEAQSMKMGDYKAMKSHIQHDEKRCNEAAEDRRYFRKVKRGRNPLKVPNPSLFE